jgi:hypothetical protein
MKQLVLPTMIATLKMATAATSTRCLTYGITSERHFPAKQTLVAAVLAVHGYHSSSNAVLAVGCSSSSNAVLAVGCSSSSSNDGNGSSSSSSSLHLLACATALLLLLLLLLLLQQQVVAGTCGIQYAAIVVCAAHTN